MNDKNHLDSTESQNDTSTSAQAPTSPSPLPIPKTASEHSPSRRRKRKWIIAALITAAIVVIVLLSLGGRGEINSNRSTVATVTREDLTVTLIESGELQAEKSDVITNKIRWEVIIEDLAEQGTSVKEGDVIVRFSCKELEEAILRLELDVESARSQLIQAEADLEQKKHEVRERLRLADQALEKEAVAIATSSISSLTFLSLPSLRRKKGEPAISVWKTKSEISIYFLIIISF